MLNNLELEILPCDEASECVCPLCGESLALCCHAGLLYDGDQLLGCICEHCLQDSPMQLAGRLRERVIDLNMFVLRARHYLSGQRWADCIDKVRLRAEHWEALASRLACLREWPIREAACALAAQGDASEPISFQKVNCL